MFSRMAPMWIHGVLIESGWLLRSVSSMALRKAYRNSSRASKARAISADQVCLRLWAVARASWMTSRIASLLISSSNDR